MVLAPEENWGQQLSAPSSAKSGMFRFLGENSSHTIGIGTAIAIASGSPMSPYRPVPSEKEN
ncbi:MAG: hypothetical protein OJF50_003779 [Nitrospira sp.]|nr:hypothetical protein [Nitrospira sp.]